MFDIPSQGPPRPGPHGTHTQAAGSFGGQKKDASNRDWADPYNSRHPHPYVHTVFLSYRAQDPKDQGWLFFQTTLCSRKPSRGPRVYPPPRVSGTRAGQMLRTVETCSDRAWLRCESLGDQSRAAGLGPEPGRPFFPVHTLLPFTGTVLGFRASESTAGSQANAVLRRVTQGPGSSWPQRPPCSCSPCCFTASPSSAVPAADGPGSLRVLHQAPFGSVRVIAAPEAEAGAQPLSGCRWLRKSPSRSAQGTGSSGGRGDGTWPGPLVAAKCRDLCACSGEAEVGSEGHGAWRRRRVGELAGAQKRPEPAAGDGCHLCRGAPCGICKDELGRRQSGDCMLKSESPLFGSLGGLGPHIADSPMERQEQAAWPPNSPTPSQCHPQALPAAGGSHTTPGSRSSLSASCSQAWGGGWQGKGGCQTG